MENEAEYSAEVRHIIAMDSIETIMLNYPWHDLEFITAPQAACLLKIRMEFLEYLDKMKAGPPVFRWKRIRVYELSAVLSWGAMVGAIGEENEEVASEGPTGA